MLSKALQAETVLPPIPVARAATSVNHRAFAGCAVFNLGVHIRLPSVYDCRVGRRGVGPSSAHAALNQRPCTTDYCDGADRENLWTRGDFTRSTPPGVRAPRCDRRA